MTKPIKVILVGCGGMGLRHLDGYIALRDAGRREVELVGVCDENEGRRSIASNRYARDGSKTLQEFADMSELLSSSDFDAVDIAVPTGLHERLTVDALSSGKHVMVEKPIALTIESALAMESAAERMGRVLAVAENFRRVPGNRAFQSWMATQRIGDVYFATSTLSLPSEFVHPQGQGDWYRDSTMAGSLAALEMGVHEMDLLQVWFGRAARVSGNVRTFEKHVTASDGRQLRSESDDTCFATVTLASGMVAQITLSMAGHGGARASRLVVGSAGSATSGCWESWEDGELAVDGEPVVSMDEAIRDWVAALPLVERERLLPTGTWDPHELRVDVGSAVRYGVAAEILDFAEAIREGRTPEVGAPQALAALAGAIAILESSFAAKEIEIDDVQRGVVTAWQESIRHGIPTTR